MKVNFLILGANDLNVKRGKYLLTPCQCHKGNKYQQYTPSFKISLRN